MQNLVLGLLWLSVKFRHFRILVDFCQNKLFSVEISFQVYWPENVRRASMAKILIGELKYMSFALWKPLVCVCDNHGPWFKSTWKKGEKCLFFCQN